MKLEELPVEAVARILSFLDWKHILVVSNLSRFLREVYQSFPELQLSYAMQTYGMVDTDPTLSMQSKLSEIERRERAWRELDPSHKVTVKVPHRTSDIYDLSGGIYLLGDRKNSLVSRDTKTLRFFDLSTCKTGPTVREEPWPEIQLETNIVDIGFGLDEFDLVAVVGITPPRNGEQGSIVLSLRELSTGAPHPLAKHPDIIVDRVHGHEGKLSIMMEIVGPRLLLLLARPRTIPGGGFIQHQDKLLLFNWWEGRKVATEIAPPSTWNGFVLLSPELILLPNHNHTLEIARLPDVSKSHYSSKGFERVIILKLPDLQPLVKLEKIRCRSEPNPKCEVHTWATEIGSDNTEYARRKRRSPVSPDSTKAIILMKMSYREYSNDEEEEEEGEDEMGEWDVTRHIVSLILRREFLLNIVGLFERSPDLYDALRTTDWGRKKLRAPTLPWFLWSTNARWQFDDTHVTNRITASAGQRYIGIDEDGHLIVRDYNPYAFRCACAVQRPGYYAATGQLKASTDDEGGSEEMLRDRMDVEDDDMETDSSTDDGTHSPEYYFPDTDEPSVQLALENKLSAPTHLSDVNTGSRTGDTSNPNASSDLSPSSNLDEDTTWQRVHIINGYKEFEKVELSEIFRDDCCFYLECVEYVSKKTYDYHGLLMDDERIIGLKEDGHGSIVEFDVLTI